MNSDNSNEQVATIDDIPVIDLEVYMNSSAAAGQEVTPEIKAMCERAADSLHKYGILIIARSLCVVPRPASQFWMRRRSWRSFNRMSRKRD